MSDRHLIRGVAATTHVDRHGERLSKEALEEMAQGYDEHTQLIYWNHETTLPPIGIVTKDWIEQREDGEYQLVFEGRLFEEKDSEFLPNSGIKGLDITWQQVKEILDSTVTSPSGHLEIRYDPRNFDVQEVSPLIKEIDELVDTEEGFYVRKAELPQAIIWVFVGFAGGHIASGFFSRLGEVAADKVLEVSKSFYNQLSGHFAEIFKQAKPEGLKPDVIFRIPFSDSEVIVEGALENATDNIIGEVLEKLPELYAIASHLIQRNSPNFFSQLKFLYNPDAKTWEINYLITRKTNKVIKGPRYYTPSHPLRSKYEKILRQLSEKDEEASKKAPDAT